MYTALLLILTLIILVYLALNLPVFGSLPKGERLQRIISQPNYKDGQLNNLSFTPMQSEGVTYRTIIAKMIIGNKFGTPQHPLPHSIPNLKPSAHLKITWFGHSSYLLQVDGINILVDPVFSERTSPFQFLGTKSFAGTYFIKVEDLPALDLVLITHDHYDHLDYLSILKLKNKTRHFIASLGVGAHLERWGIAPDQITELAWGETTSPMANLSFTSTSARHFSGRKFKRNQSVWASFVLKTKNNTLYLGGDSGYDKHFKEIGEKYGPFDVAILECGQYNTMWPLIHMFPEEVAQASIDLNAKYLMPVHWGKFRLALHDWDDPIKRVVAKSEEIGIKIITPMLGESFLLDKEQPNTKWWADL